MYVEWKVNVNIRF